MDKEAINWSSAGKVAAWPIQLLWKGIKGYGGSINKGLNRGLVRLGTAIPPAVAVGGLGYAGYKNRDWIGDKLSRGIGFAKTHIEKGLEDVKNDINKPPETPLATSDPSKANPGTAFDPTAAMTGKTFFVPQWWLKRFPGHEQGASVAWLAGASSLLAAGLIGGYRLLRHDDELIDIDDADRPGRDLAKQISTTFQGPLSDSRQKKKKKKQEKKAAEEYQDVPNDNTFTPFTLVKGAIPLGATVLAAALAYKGADALADAHRNFRLDRSIAKKDQMVKDLISTRARIAKGNATDEEVNGVIQPAVDAGLYMKKANYGLDQLVAGAGVLSSAILLASAIGAYAYTSAGDENNLKYKAYKKALREYAKAKSGMTPITVAPADSSEYFSSIDQGANTTPAVARYQPQLDTDSLNKPISVSF